MHLEEACTVVSVAGEGCGEHVTYVRWCVSLRISYTTLLDPTACRMVHTVLRGRPLPLTGYFRNPIRVWRFGPGNPPVLSADPWRENAGMSDEHTE